MFCGSVPTVCILSTHTAVAPVLGFYLFDLNMRQESSSRRTRSASSSTGSRLVTYWACMFRVTTGVLINGKPQSVHMGIDHEPELQCSWVWGHQLATWCPALALVCATLLDTKQKGP